MPMFVRSAFAAQQYAMSQNLHTRPILALRLVLKSSVSMLAGVIHENRPFCSRLAGAVADRAVAIRQSGRRDLLQLSAGMGRLGLDAQGDQGRPQLRHS